MLNIAILVLNFGSLAGIVIGLLLRSARVREALEAAYVHSSDMAEGRESREVVHLLIWSFIRTALLNSNGSLSLKKLLGVSFLSSVVFSVTVAPVLPEASPTSPIAKLFGGGDAGVIVAIVAKYLLAWPGHYIYDYLVCRVLLATTRSGRLRTLRGQTIAAILSLIAVSFAPLLVIAVFVYSRFYLPGIPTYISWDSILIGVPLFWNGPTFFWIGVANTFLEQEWLSFMDASRMTMFVLSAMISSATAFFDLLARILVSNNAAMRILSASLLSVSTADADKIFTASLTAFAVGNGLCQIFGVSVKL